MSDRAPGGDEAGHAAEPAGAPSSNGTAEAPPAADAGAAEPGAAAAGAPEPAVAGEAGETAACGQCAEYLDSLTRLKAEFANFRRRAGEQQAQAAERGAADLATRLLAVLDAGEAGAAHSAEVVGPLHTVLVDTLAAEGLEVISPLHEPFDPACHEAVRFATAQPGDGPAAGEQIVSEVLRTGYAWNGRVLRPAAVGVQG